MPILMSQQKAVLLWFFRQIKIAVWLTGIILEAITDAEKIVIAEVKSQNYIKARARLI